MVPNKRPPATPSTIPPRKAVAKCATPAARSVRAFSVSVATRTEKSTMAAASLSRLSPSSSRVRRAGAPTSRKIATTAAGSVVATIAPTNNATVSGIPAAKDRLKPIAAAAANTATIAKVRIGAQSGAISRRSIVSAAWKQQQRQEHDEKDRRVEREVGDRPYDVVEGVGQRGIEQKRRDAADRHADNGEQHGVRQMEPLRSGLDDAGENQKSRQDEGDARDADQLRVFAKLAMGSGAPVAFAASLYQPPFGAKLCRFAVRRTDRGSEHLAAAFDKGAYV